MNSNPFISTFNTPFNTPPFEEINIKHYKPAIKESIEKARNEIDRITSGTEKPTFQNTIEALEKAGEQLERVASIFFNLNEAETNQEMQQLAPELSEMITEYSNDVNMNKALFERIKAVYEQKDKLDLSNEQVMLLDDTYKGFIRGGANLPEDKKERFREISQQLSKLSLKFNENLLAETNAFELHITDEGEMAGLPDFVKESASEEAKSRDKDGWVFTLHHPSFGPFMKYSDKRELREKIYRAYTSRCNKNNEFDNKEIVKQIVNLRIEKANLLGYETYADMVLVNRMAKSKDKVENLLQQLFEASHPFAVKDKEEVEKIAREMGTNNDLQRWDWSYYSEKLRKKQFDLTDEMTKPYFELNSVIDAIFELANRLYGLTLKPNKNIQVYHKDVSAYEVHDENGLRSILYLDFHPRKGKGQGAWMTTFREQKRENGQFQCPHVSLVTNFTKPTSTKPALLTFDEVTTFLHEFGHALHAMLSNVTYESLSCTNVYRDFVELPSQILENWALEKEWLDTWAKHYETGEKIPQELIEKIKAARNFQSGYQSDRQISFGWTDMAWHTLKEPFKGEVVEFEQKAMQPIELFPTVDGSAFSTGFGHIFAGGYAAGYYGYKWAEVLDADAFELFLEKGIFNKEVAKKFEDNILSKGGTEHPMELYKRFRGQEPSVEALLKRSGLKN